MAASEVPDAMSQDPEAATNNSTNGVESWPDDLEICVEYCTRRPFHARYDPDKYQEYFQMVSEAFCVRNVQTKIVGNPPSGRRDLRALNQFVTQDTDFPRLGAFEVAVNSEKTGLVLIFSKLQTRRWPNPKILVVQVDRVLRGQELLQPVGMPLDENGFRSPRRAPPRPMEQGSYGSPRSNTSAPSTARTPQAPQAPDTATPSPSKAKKEKKESVKKGRKEAPGTQEAVPASKDPKGLVNTAQPVESASEVEEAPYNEDEFEGEESAEGSSGFGTKVWMPGAAKEEKWEDDDPKVASSNAPEAQA